MLLVEAKVKHPLLVIVAQWDQLNLLNNFTPYGSKPVLPTHITDYSVFPCLLGSLNQIDAPFMLRIIRVLGRIQQYLRLSIDCSCCRMDLVVDGCVGKLIMIGRDLGAQVTT